jgi:hypothetical protein
MCFDTQAMCFDTQGMMFRYSSIMCMFLVDVVDNDVESADNLAILFSIEIIWWLGKSCWVVSTVHIIVDFNNKPVEQQANRFDSRTMLWRVPMLD